MLEFLPECECCGIQGSFGKDIFVKEMRKAGILEIYKNNMNADE